MALSLATTAHAADVIDQNAPVNNVYMAGFYQADLAQSFKQTAGNISGAGIFAVTDFGSTNITIQLWNALPNNNGSLLASGTGSTSSTGWFDVFWDPVSIAPATTYFLVFSGTNPRDGVGGDRDNGYAAGQVFANSGYQSFSGYDYTFRTFASDNVQSGVPEPATWAMMLVGFGLVGVGMRRRQRVTVRYA